MPKQKGFQVIPGGKANPEAAGAPASLDLPQLLARAREHRIGLAARTCEVTDTLLLDYEDAIEALRRLEESSDAGVQPRMAEYRRLIAELDAEILEMRRRPLP